MRSVLAAEARAIQSVDVTPAYEMAARQIAACVGKIVTTGMGKAGLMAQKFAATLCSTGTPAVFLHPGEAAHGDLGLIETDDVIVVFSTSGKTAEVLELLESARNLAEGRGNWPWVIGITSHPDGAIRQRCDVVLDMGVIDEPCPLGLTPSASTAVMLAIGDALALSVMLLKDIRREDFGKRHRGGYLGQVAVR
jgi:arabinose-5-phosphate isomerase